MAKEFWTSSYASGYPDRIQRPDTNDVLDGSGAIENRVRIGERLRMEKSIPKEGKILDLGAGPCSGMIFGGDIDRVTAVDASQALLERNPAPREQKFLIDLAREPLPVAWKEKYSLVTAVLFHRYITEEQSAHLAGEVLKVLKPGEAFMIIDQASVPDPTLGALMGEERVFDADEEGDILERAGFGFIRTDQMLLFDIPDGFFPPIVLDVVSGRK